MQTRQICPAVRAHSRTGQRVWFNQVHLFHITSLKAEVRDFLLSTLPRDRIPKNAFYGDGLEIESDVLEEIRDAYRSEEIRFPWDRGDVLILDNMLFAHGRDPYRGPRRVVVGMAEALREGPVDRSGGCDEEPS